MSAPSPGALRGARLAGAALDVFERESEVEGELLELENVVLTPHTGERDRSRREAMGIPCVEALRSALLEARLPRNAVNPEAWAHLARLSTLSRRDAPWAATIVEA